ncbi:inositol monophosphatase family protein [Krasilnikovia sp. MM14-A1259]|uniref:inositol monophosphatase family protein n=1 Tax=Krasilnikovia sp. MM14-A1259 TaxID=3373539 RepID=UPI0038004DFA
MPRAAPETTGAHDLHALAIEAARAGAAAIRAVCKDALPGLDGQASADPNRLAVTVKDGVEDFVTAADLAAEEAIVATIRATRPDDRIVAEESGVENGSSDVCWYIDPIDGTANFIAGKPDYAVSIAAHRGGEPEAAVVYRPADQTWLATAPHDRLQGNLAYGLNAPASLAAAEVSLSRPHEPARRHEAMALRDALLPLVALERRVGSAACALLEVTTGRLDAYVSVDLPPWDTAAGHRLVETAGGCVRVVRVPSGHPVSIAAAPALADLLAALVSGTPGS